MSEKLPPAVELHIHNYICEYGEKLLQDIGHPCKGCPIEKEQNTMLARPDTCYHCILWAIRVDAATLALLLRLDKKNFGEE